MATSTELSNTLDLIMDQGSSFEYEFTLDRSDATPFDLSGFDARLQVRRTYGNTSILVNATLMNGKLAITSPAIGVMKLLLLPGDTSSIRFDHKDDEELDCVYDLEIIRADGKVYKPCRGQFLLRREVTR